jgi:hypothetical protein
MTEKDKNDIIVKTADRVESIYKAIYGNGKPGLLDRMTSVEIKQSTCPARNRDWLKLGGFVFGGVSCGVALGMFVINILPKLIDKI